MHPWTPHPDANCLIALLATRLPEVLGDALVGLYLDGSLALGEFDAASDIDFVAVTRGELSQADFDALQRLHADIARLDWPLADQIEGFYVSQAALRRYDPAHRRFANLERGPDEQLKWVAQDEYWTVHRWVLREHGIVVLGPPPADLIDPLTADDLRAAMRAALREWGGYLHAHPHLAAQPGYQSYAVLTVCRMRYTLVHGRLVPKSTAAAWALESLDARWRLLIKAALLDRLAPDRAPTPEQAQATLDFLTEAMWHSVHFGMTPYGSLKIPELNARPG